MISNVIIFPTLQKIQSAITVIRILLITVLPADQIENNIGGYADKERAVNDQHIYPPTKIIQKTSIKKTY